MDLIGHCDPYVLLTARQPGEATPIVYRTEVVRSSPSPQWQETVSITNLAAGTQLEFEVWDFDRGRQDESVGRCTVQFDGRSLMVDGSPAGGPLLDLRLTGQQGRQMGSVQVQALFKPSKLPGAPRLTGPVHYRRHISVVTGLLSSCWSGDMEPAFYTYKVYLHGIASMMGPTQCHWNRGYQAAQTIFQSPTIQANIRAAHSVLYSTSAGTKSGTLKSAADFFEVIGYGRRRGKMRVFSYALMEDAMRFSETGPSFFKDTISKHALHANCEEKVYYAGEFCVVRTGPDTGSQAASSNGDRPDGSSSGCDSLGSSSYVSASSGRGSYRLIIDNNSGTYTPDPARLPQLVQLLLNSFPDMDIEALAQDDPKLKVYQKLGSAASLPHTAGEGLSSMDDPPSTPSLGSLLISEPLSEQL